MSAADKVRRRGSVPVHISTEKCIRCGVCMDECPEAALSYGAGNIPVVDEAACSGCGKCFEVCCTGALSLE
jgi:ferredoxin